MTAGRGRKRLADKVVDRRGELGLTQAELAARVENFSLKTLQRIEAGELDVRATTLGKLDRALGWKTGSARAIREGREPTIEGVPLTAVPVPAEDIPFPTDPHYQRKYEDLRAIGWSREESVQTLKLRRALEEADEILGA